MTNKPNTTKSKPVTKGAPGGRTDQQRTTKTDRLVQLLQVRTGRNIGTLSAKLGWQVHSTRAALSRLRKAGYAIDKLPPLKQGGSRYRISSAPVAR